MKSKCTLVLLGCLVVSLLAVPALAADPTVSPEEAAFTSLKERLYERVERGVIAEIAVERFLAALDEQKDELAEISEKGNDAVQQTIRHLFNDTRLTVSGREADQIAETAARWVVMRQLRDSDEVLTPTRRQRR